MNDEFAEPTLPALRKAIYRKLALLLTAGVVAFVLVSIVIFHTSTLSTCDARPWALGVHIFTLCTFVISSIFCATFAIKIIRAGQLPLPEALLFRRMQIKRGRLVFIMACFFLALAGLILFITGVDTALTLIAYQSTESQDCAPIR